MFRLRVRLFVGFLIYITVVSGCRHHSTSPAEGLPADSTALLKAIFRDPVECSPCHPDHYAQWQMSMHAYALADPVFLALNETGQRRSNNQLGQFCTKCHSPLGPALNETPAGFNPDALTPLVKHGVHCDVCHLIADFSGGDGVAQFHFDGIRRGSIEDPVGNSVHESEFDQRFGLSAMCQPCHDVLAPDKSMLIERTSTEWDESPYAGMGLECQDCHMPASDGPAAPGGPVRQVHDHRMVGADFPLVDFPGKEETIVRVAKLLSNAITLKVQSPETIRPGELLSFAVSVQNDKTGHSIPSGNTVDRQMWIQALVTDEDSGELIFATGLLGDNGDLLNHNSESVTSGLVPEDGNLVLFNTVAYDRNDQETHFFWEAQRLEHNIIPAFETHTSNFEVQVPGSVGRMRMDVRLLFRAFPPYLLHEIGLQHLQSELRIFEMAAVNRVINVTD
jgi:hypothetical protein